MVLYASNQKIKILLTNKINKLNFIQNLILINILVKN
jgi:hypothetical protein